MQPPDFTIRGDRKCDRQARVYESHESVRMACLEASMEKAGDDPAFIAVALGNIARAFGMVRLANDTGLTGEGLY